MMLLNRLRRVTRDELAWRSTAHARIAVRRLETRLRQPRWNRDDLPRALADHVGGPALRQAVAAKDWMAAHHILADAVRTRPTRFVLDPSTLDDMRAAISDRWPAAASDAAERADRILAGHYDLLGYRGLTFARPGRGVDWHLDPVHNRRAPAVFWADVRYLDPAVGDHKIIWELNRHQQWLQLGRALWLTRDGRYGDEIVNQLESWLAENPPLVGINWASMLEVGFRAMSWTWALHFLIAEAAGAKAPALQVRSAAASAAAVPWIVDLLVALDRQMTHLEQNLSYYFSPNTHLTGEALALYVVGSALPELASSGRWSETGRRILMTEIDRQIQADGGHVERSTHYQRYTLDFYLLAWLTAERVQDRDAIAMFREAVTRLAEFTRTMADDRGRLPLIGDDDGGMLWPLAGRACDDVSDSLALAAVALGRPELAPWGVREEACWVGGRLVVDAARSVETRGTVAATTSSRTLAETGYVVMRDGAGGQAVFDVGLHGFLNGGHAHADALAMTLTLRNRPFLVDPGTSTYTMDARLRDLLRSSTSHNTITLDDRSQAIPSGPFHWRTRADGRLHASRHNAAFDWAEGSHDGYAPLRHTRAVLRTLDNGWLIVDSIEGDGRHTAAAHWHFDPGWMVACDAPGRLRATHLEGERAWLLYDGGEPSLAHGNEETGQGWFAPAYGTLIPAWTACIAREGTVPFAAVTWLDSANMSSGAPVLERITAECEAGGRVMAARVVRDGRISTFMFRLDERSSRDTPASSVGHYQTDARVLHYTEHRDGTFVLDLVDAGHALAPRERGVSVTAGEPVADLHVAFESDVLDVRSSTPPAQLRVEGAALRCARIVRMNGRDRAPEIDAAGAMVITSADWGAAAFVIHDS